MNIRSNACALVVLVSVGVFQQSVAPMQRNNNNNNQIAARNNTNAVVTQGSNNFLSTLTNLVTDPRLINTASVIINNHSHQLKPLIANALGEESEELVNAAYDLALIVLDPTKTPARRLEALFNILSVSHNYQLLQVTEIANLIPFLATACNKSLSPLSLDIIQKAGNKNDCSLGMFFLAAASLSKDFKYYITGMDEDTVDMFLIAATNGKNRLTDSTKDFTRLLTSAENFEYFINENMLAIADKISEIQ